MGDRDEIALHVPSDSIFAGIIKRRARARCLMLCRCTGTVRIHHSGLMSQKSFQL